MAGWTRYSEITGTTESGFYEYPFMVRGTPRKQGFWDHPEDVTICSFRTEAEAVLWLRRNEEDYKKGPNGFASLHVENWNE